MLQEAYNLNIEKTVDGLLVIPDAKFSESEAVQSHGQLNAGDLMLMAIYSYHKGWIAKARQFLRPIKNLLQVRSTGKLAKNETQTPLHEAFSEIKNLLNQKYADKEDMKADTWEFTPYHSSSGKIANTMGKTMFFKNIHQDCLVIQMGEI